MIEIQAKKKLHSSEGEMLLHVDITIEKGSFVSLYGKSGAGKTSIFRMLSGLLNPDEGFICAHGSVWYDSSNKVNIAPQKRNIGFVFQDYALFPNMTVRENLAFVLPKKEMHHSIDEILEITGLAGLSSRYPVTLSGGQQQRVALARALARRPAILLLDEPMSSLDYDMRIKLQDEIGKIHRYFNLTTLLISHEPTEIYRLSDKVIEMDHGKVLQQCCPSELFHQNDITGKLQFRGQVVEITKSDIIYIAKVLVGNKISKIVITADQAQNFCSGDQVLVISKAFNPVMIKLEK